MKKNRETRGASIGRVSGNLEQSNIAAGDKKNATITVSGQQVPVDQEPSLEEFQELLAGILKSLNELAAEEQTLKAISPAAPYMVMGAAQNIAEAARHAESAARQAESAAAAAAGAAGESVAEQQAEQAKTVQTWLKEAYSLLANVMDGARTLAEKADRLGQAAEALFVRMEPVLKYLSVALLWAGKNNSP